MSLDVYKRQELGRVGSSEFLRVAVFAASPFKNFGPTRLNPTTRAPPVFTN